MRPSGATSSPGVSPWEPCGNSSASTGRMAPSMPRQRLAQLPDDARPPIEAVKMLTYTVEPSAVAAMPAGWQRVGSGIVPPRYRHAVLPSDSNTSPFAWTA